MTASSIVVFSIIASVPHHSRRPNRSFAATETDKISCVLVVGFSLSAERTFCPSTR